MQSRRVFISKVATGLAGTLAASNVLGANDRIRIGIIGPGARGSEILREALACENVECAGAADVYTKRLEDVKKIAPDAKTYLDYRRLLEDKSIDAVLIATPQHLHAEHFMAALDAGKHVYQEKTMAFTVEHAKKMRAAWQRAGKRTVQIGHQWISTRPDGRRRQLSEARADGQDHRHPRPHVPQHAARQAAVGPARLSRYDGRRTSSGKRSWARRRSAPFDANRYINWRFFWDYSGGNVYENMCHQLAFWYKALGLKIPKAVTMTGGLYLWKDGREVPDTMNVSMEHAEEILFTWDSGFGNDQLNVTEDVLGDRRHHLAQPADPLPAAKGEPAGRQRNDGPDAHRAAGPHAEFPRLHPLGPGAELPVRAGLSAFPWPAAARTRWAKMAPFPGASRSAIRRKR